jgi:tetratricopeptide (TPR) repeat protein
MRQTPLGLILAGLLAASAAAADSSAFAAPAAAAEADVSKSGPELLRLDRDLSKIQDAKENGRVTSERYKEFLVRFRTELDAAMSEAPPSAANTALHSRILARLGEFKQAADALGVALSRDPVNRDLRLALSQVRFDEKNYPAALVEADAVLARDPDNKEALALKHFSEGRAAMNGAEPGDRSPAAPARKPFARRFHFAGSDPATLPFKLPVKMTPAAEPRDLKAGGAPASPGPLPLVPLAEAAVLGLAAYEVSRSRAAYASTDGLDDEHPKPVGRYQRLVAGAILAGALGGVLYTAGAAVVSAAPLALGYATSIGNHGLRLATSEAGAINPGEVKAVNDIPKVLARVIPYEPGTEIPEMFGRPDKAHAFVTAAEDISGLNAAELPQRLGIEPARQFLVIRFPAPTVGVSTPLIFDHPSFVGGGLTSGGAREFIIANELIPSVATYEVVK